jgi:ribonuclease Z
MIRVTLLGSAATLSGPDSDSIYLLIQSEQGCYLIDCGGSPPHKLARAGAELRQVRGVLLTHDHADHIYGLPMLVQGLLLSDWSEAGLIVWGLRETLATAKTLLDLFPLVDLAPLDLRPLAPQPDYLALETAELRIRTTPVDHMQPSVGVRIEGVRSGRALAYSSDTEPCDGLRQLAAGADVLLHEAAAIRPTAGHSTPGQAGATAAAAGVGRLVLVHFEPAEDSETLLAEAAKKFGGPVELGRDWMTFEL